MLKDPAASGIRGKGEDPKNRYSNFKSVRHKSCRSVFSRKSCHIEDRSLKTRPKRYCIPTTNAIAIETRPKTYRTQMRNPMRTSATYFWQESSYAVWHLN
jgi:hypothetical protein